MTALPATPRSSAVDVVHGVAVADPYRWLEDGAAPETAAWVAAQNRHTRRAVDILPDRSAWRDRLVALLAVPMSRSCRVAGDRVFTLERAGGSPQYRLVVRSATDPTEPARVVVDPSQVAADATASIDWYHPSFDGRLVAYGLSQGGDERSVLRVFDLDASAHRADEIPHARAASVGWLPGGTGFLYTRYPADSEYDRRVFEHRLGADWSDDSVVWDDLPTREAWPDVDVSPDGRWALVHVQIGWSRTDVHLLDRAGGTWQTAIAGVEARSAFEIDGDRVLGFTTLDAPRGRVVVASCDRPDRWETVVAEEPWVIDAVAAAGDVFYVLGSERAVAVLEQRGRAGDLHRRVDLPDLGTFAGFDTQRETGRAFFQLESYTRPPALWRASPGGDTEPWGAENTGVDPSRFVVHREAFASADGTSIGLFVVRRADTEPNPSTPTVLTGYGGFAIASTPVWSPLAAAWCEQGGTYAVAGLRGGSEEGEAWHRAGMRADKQNVFDDFAAAADHLVATGRTTRDKLALAGRSNGGLLVAVAITQRPDLARAVHCGVPLADMVRFSQFLIARLWTPEYGDPDVPEEFAWLYAYSPYHHVGAGTCYPAVLVTTAEGDSRVDPAHARKMAAQLQWASSCQEQRPVLFHEEGRAGHGVGKPLQKQADEAADILSFFSWQLGVA